MFEVVENVDFSADCLRRNDFVRLRHQTCSVYFPHVINLYFDLNAVFLWVIFASHHLCHSGLSIFQPSIILSRIFRTFQRDLDLDDLDIVLFVIRCVRANQQSLNREVTAVRTKTGVTKLSKLTCL